MDASPLRFELGRADANTPSSERDTSDASQIPDYPQEVISGQTPSMIEDTSDDPKVRWSPAQRSAPQYPSSEPNEAPNTKDQTVSAEDGWAAFKGLTGTITQSPSTTQANTIGITAPRPPKPFTSNPTPSTSSPTDLPYASSSSSHSAPKKEAAKREFHLAITPSTLNHQAYIQRQHYYGGWRLDDRTLMADDLMGRVPVEGFRDCDLSKGETPMRVRLRRREKEQQDEREGKFGGEGSGRRKRLRLRDLWEDGRVMREELAKGRADL
ncbi:hypothetical protein P7C71_g546, partial [Lecanoromycetidae sp. Uapishka_2]